VALFIFLSGHITIACVTVFLHRAQTHQSIAMSYWASLPMRIWLWLSTGMVTKEWVACHRKHHAFVDRAGDPHSPAEHGLMAILFFGVVHYRRAFKDKNILNEFGYDTPDDWLERKIFTPYNIAGVWILLAIQILLFGWLVGGIIWAFQMIWVPFWAAGVVNGVGHYFGYRNFNTKDHSRNVVPIGIWLSGEELHNNHHNDPKAPKFSVKWFEFDMGWLYIKILSFFGLARVLRKQRETLPMAA